MYKIWSQSGCCGQSQWCPTEIFIININKFLHFGDATQSTKYFHIS